MPIVDIAQFDESISMDIGRYGDQDEDEMYLRRLSTYATHRQGDLKQETPQLPGYRSFRDILKGWQTAELEDKHAIQTIDERTETPQEPQPCDLLVKGFNVDERILPGFRYRVRDLGGDGFLFSGEARRLESIGLGYGRRLTFKGDKLNFNDCFFWSDSSPDGFAFNIEAVKEGDVFTIVDDKHTVTGTITVQSVDFPQIEKDTVMEGKAVVKKVGVRFACSIKQFYSQHSLVNIDAPAFDVVKGVAELVKEKGSKEAVVRCIKDVFFQSLGKCELHAE